MKNTPLRFVPLLAAALLSTGCASVFLSGHDDLKVVTKPPGAVARVGDLSVVTPGVLKVPRDKRPVVLEIEKEGYEPVDVPIRRTRHGAVWANAAYVATGIALTVASTVTLWGPSAPPDWTPALVGASATAAGTTIDLSTDRTLCLERDEVVVDLKPRAAAAAGGAR